MSQAKIEETLQGYILDLSRIFMTGLFYLNKIRVCDIIVKTIVNCFVIKFLILSMASSRVSQTFWATDSYLQIFFSRPKKTKTVSFLKKKPSL